MVAEYSSAQAPSNPNIHYTVTDRLGSPRVLVGKYGEITSRRDFMPFGEELYADGSHRTTNGKYTLSGEDAVRKRFTGYEKDDEIGLDFAEARYYNNQHARFMVVDPLITSGKSGTPQSFNRYVYCLNNPLFFTDPSGLQVVFSVSEKPTGNWHMPITSEGEPDSSRIYKYIKNGDATDGYRLVTDRNSRGWLIGSGSGLRDGWVVNFNPYGPRGYSSYGQVLLDITFGDLGGQEYFRNGYNLIRSDEEQAAYNRTGAVETAFGPGEVAFMFTPAKLSFATKTFANSEKSVISSGSSAIDGKNLAKKLASDAQMTEVGTRMAGPGARAGYRDAADKAALYGGKASDYVKMSSSSYDGGNITGNFATQVFETHWVENTFTGLKYEFKTKFPRDSSQKNNGTI